MWTDEKPKSKLSKPGSLESVKCAVSACSLGVVRLAVRLVGAGFLCIVKKKPCQTTD